MEQVFGEHSRICLSNDMSCEEHADCQDRHFSGVCFNGQCAYQAEHHCDPEMMGENGFGQAVVESQDFGGGDLSGGGTILMKTKMISPMVLDCSIWMLPFTQVSTALVTSTCSV